MSLADDISTALQSIGLKTEIKSDNPIHIVGGEAIRTVTIGNVSGIRIFTLMFTIKFSNNKWAVYLPEGQIMDEYHLDTSDEVIEVVTNHYQRIRAYTKNYSELDG